MAKKDIMGTSRTFNLCLLKIVVITRPVCLDFTEAVAQSENFIIDSFAGPFGGFDNFRTIYTLP